MKKIIKNLAVPLLLGTIIGLIISSSMNYNQINKPPLSPTPIVFPIVWTLLYTLMGISTYLISKTNKIPPIYYIQLIVNLIWPIIFFTLKWYLFAFIWLILLIVLIIVMISRFKQINKTTAYLQIPYLLWCLFASYLNLGIYILN